MVDKITITVKFTLTELQIINEVMGHHIEELENFDKVSPAKKNLQKQLKKIEEWIYEEKRKANIDKKVSREGIEERIQNETIKRVCVSCDD
tara:strand:+ start:592 stop:864 length:273 start_codon:yes stop_codon:yes gene_type:complete